MVEAMMKKKALKCPFYCPACGEETEAALLRGTLFASPDEPAIKCVLCGTKFRIELFPERDWK